MLPEAEVPRSFINGLDTLCIDACSIIYQLRTGLLGSLAAEVALISTPSVIKEVDWPHLPVTPVDEENSDETNDRNLFLLARGRNIPLMTEDLELIKAAWKEGMEHYNSLMMLNYLLLKGRVTEEEYPEYLERLTSYGRYSREVLEYGAEVYRLIRSQKTD